MNQSKQTIDFLNHGQKLTNLIKAYGSNPIRPAHGKLNYNICKTMQDARKTNPNFRDEFSSAYGGDQTVFRRVPGEMSKYIDSGILAVKRPAHIDKFI